MDCKFVFVEWIDSRGTPTLWEHCQEVNTIPPSHPWSSGFIIDKNEDYITLLQTVDKEQIMGRVTIPQCAILDIFYIDTPIKVTRTDEGFDIIREPERSITTSMKEGRP